MLDSLSIDNRTDSLINEPQKTIVKNSSTPDAAATDAPPAANHTADAAAPISEISSAAPEVTATAGEALISEATVPLDKYDEVLRAKDELLDMLLRRQAEFENLRRRTEREKSEFLEFALSSFVMELLPILDGLDRSLQATQGETLESFKMGICLVLKQFRDILDAAGLRAIKTQDQQFDPNLHHAVIKEETTEFPDNQIVEEFQSGYTFKDRLLRPSMVKVAASVPKEITGTGIEGGQGNPAARIESAESLKPGLDC
jgi:molecular chaperone GrpE